MGELITLSFAKGSITCNDEISVPASKRISKRLLILQALAGNAIRIEDLHQADATVLLGNALRVRSGRVNLGPAGTALRFGIAWAAITPGTRVLRREAR